MFYSFLYRIKTPLKFIVYILASATLFFAIYFSLLEAVKISKFSVDTINFSLGQKEPPLSSLESAGAVEVKVPASKSHSNTKVQAVPWKYDFRAYIFDKYFEVNKSPLYGYGRVFTEACDKYNTPKDCLLIVAIAKAETDLCKTAGADAQKNCWGFGGSGPNRIVWPSYYVSIDEVTRRVMDGYGADFFQDANNGELYYCGPHCDKWGDVVNSYKKQINEFAIDLGFPSLL